ncbi:pentapeptide repeat-containing protein [Deinococcus hopiensis]|uniref:Uncharacterized protein YjbI, contains pentapeptide repeats n=1 Tax=Deinococcus hopiensis KR-140 TaxID=695939 RepID=A0A1W1VFH9_9DEIO|nr:pentapeptide repeat-containing protein [Deinococcus hopiensis]SMB92112.1 Uncharacterized protein YjbI, contains pentapeptide repeats [Deinococcus hopiensis KR-140]
MTVAASRPPQVPKFPRGGLRPLFPEHLEDEGVYRSAVLEGQDLSGRALHAVTFEACVFREVNLREAAWSHVRLRDVRFEGSDLSGAKWTETGVQRAQFTDCRLLGFQAPEAVLGHVRLTRVQAGLALFLKVDAKALWLEDCDLSEATFMDARLPGAVFQRCTLRRTDFRGAKMPAADLRGSNLSGLRIGLPELEQVVVEAAQLADLAFLLGVRLSE